MNDVQVIQGGATAAGAEVPPRRFCLTFEIPVRTVSEANVAGHEHHLITSTRRRKQRELARLVANTQRALLVRAAERLQATTARIRLTRLGGRRLDQGNVAASMKAVQDGLCDGLRISDGDEKYQWDYDQRPAGAKARGVRVEIDIG